MAYTKKGAPKKSKKAVKKVTAKKKPAPALIPVGKRKKAQTHATHLLNPISPKKSKGVKLPPLSEKEKALLNVRNGQTPYVVHVTNTDSESGKSQKVVLGAVKNDAESKASEMKKLLEVLESSVGQTAESDPVTTTYSERLFRRDRTKRVSVTVRNVTTFTLKDVSIFNNGFMKQQDVHYSTLSDAMTYEDLLRRKNAMNNDNNTVAHVHIISNNNNQPFRTLWFISTDIDGAQMKIPVQPLLDPLQQQAAISVVQYKFPLNNCLDVVISDLAPDTRVTYTFTVTDSPAT